MQKTTVWMASATSFPTTTRPRARGRESTSSS